MLHERLEVRHPLPVETGTHTAINGIVYAIPFAVVLWAAIAAILYLII